MIKFSEGNHQYWIDGTRATSVTTALNGIPKGALPNWAARTVAEHVVDHLGDVEQMVDAGGRGPAVEFLRALPDQKRDSAAVRGTAVHQLAEQYVRHQAVDVDEDLLPYVQSYARFIDDFDPTSVHEELMIGNREHRYAGRLDSIQQIPGQGLALVDYKTSRGVYGETALQVAAYRFAEFYVDAEGEEQPMLEVDATFVLHIQPNGYDLIPLQSDRTAFEAFLIAKANYLTNVQSRRLDKLLGEPVQPPRRDAA